MLSSSMPTAVNSCKTAVANVQLERHAKKGRVQQGWQRSGDTVPCLAPMWHQEIASLLSQPQAGVACCRVALPEELGAKQLRLSQLCAACCLWLQP